MIGKIDEIKPLLEDFYKEHGTPLFSFLSGSIAENISTPNSDFDVYAVYESVIEEEIPIDSWEYPIEVTKITLGKFITIFEMLKDDQGFYNAAPYELLLVHRVVTSIPITGHDRYESFKSNFSKSFFLMRLDELCQRYSERSLKVVFGCMRGNDYLSALWNANHAVRQSLSRLLISKGCTSLLEKWQVKYAELLLGEGCVPNTYYKEFLVDIPFSSELKKYDYLKNALLFSQAVSDYQLLSMFLDDDEFWALSRLGLTDVNNPFSIHKTPYARLVYTGSEYYIFFKDEPLISLSKQSAVVWACIDNISNFRELCDRVEKINRFTDKEISEHLKLFISEGLVFTNHVFNEGEYS